MPGKELVSDRVLYDLFRTWHSDSLIDKRNFNTQLGKYIEPKSTSGRRFYLVNKNFVLLTQLIQEHNRNRSLDRRKSKTWQNHFERFLEDTKVIPGNLFIEADILYYLYSRWADSINRKGIFSYYTFIQLMELSFERKALSRGALTWFGVTKDIKNSINKEEVTRWREGRWKKHTYEKNKTPVQYRYKKFAIYTEDFKKPKVGKPSKRSRKKIHPKD